MPIIQETLNINNLRTTRAKSINLHTIRKLIEYYLKNVLVKAGNIDFTRFRDIAVEGSSVSSPAQRGPGSERVNLINNNHSITFMN